jgi:hypothetical protein
MHPDIPQCIPAPSAFPTPRIYTSFRSLADLASPALYASDRYLAGHPDTADALTRMEQVIAKVASAWLEVCHPLAVHSCLVLFSCTRRNSAQTTDGSPKSISR